MHQVHQYVATNGITLHVVTAGPEDCPPVILLHGFPEFWYGWRGQIPALAAAGYRVIVPDQRGYNLSDKPAGLAAYNHDVLAADVLGLMQAFGYESVYLAGHDFGASVAWWTAIKYPERVRRLAILNVPHPAVMRRYARTHRRQQLRSWYIAFFQLPWLPEAGLRAGNYAALARALQASSQAGTFSAADLEQYRGAWGRPGALTAMLNWYRALVRTRPERAKDSRVRVPVRIIWGVHDVALSQEMAPRSVARCDEGELFLMEDATHWVQHEEAERVNSLLLEFFGRA